MYLWEPIRMAYSQTYYKNEPIKREWFSQYIIIRKHGLMMITIINAQMDRVRIIVNEVVNYKREGRLNVMDLSQ